MADTSIRAIRPPKAVMIELGDKVRELVFDMNAWAALSEAYKNPDAVLERMDKKDLGAFRALIWAALQSEEGVLTEKEVGRMIPVMDRGAMQLLGTALGEALRNALPQDPQGNAQTPSRIPEAGDGIGHGSTTSGQ